MAASLRIPVSSTEYLKVTVTADVTLSAQAVSVAIIPARSRPGPPYWQPAAWTGTAGTTRTAMLLIGPNSDNVLTVGEYDVWVLLEDNPEQPTDPAGRLTVY